MLNDQFVLYQVANSRYNNCYVGHGKRTIMAAATRLIGQTFPQFHFTPRPRRTNLISMQTPILVLHSCGVNIFVNTNTQLEKRPSMTLVKSTYGHCRWLICNLPQKSHKRNAQMHMLECILGFKKALSAYVSFNPAIHMTIYWNEQFKPVNVYCHMTFS